MKKIFVILSVFAMIMFFSCKQKAIESVSVNDSIQVDSVELVETIDSLSVDSVE